MLPKELLSKVKKIHLQTKRLVSDVLAGQYTAAFRGQGMEFSEVREYVPGDDVRHIDWNVTAKMQKPYIKQFVEERELTVLLLVDISLSGLYSSTEITKAEMNAQICAILALSAVRNNDKVGLVLFSDKVEAYIPVGKGKSHVLRVIREVLAANPQSRGTSLKNALDFLNKVQKRKAVVFLISDFQDQDYEKSLKIAANRHDLVAVEVYDPVEMGLPSMGLVELMDAETGQYLLVDTKDPVFQKNFAVMAQANREQRKSMLRKSLVDSISMPLGAEKNRFDPLIHFFAGRRRAS